MARDFGSERRVTQRVQSARRVSSTLVFSEVFEEARRVLLTVSISKNFEELIMNNGNQNNGTGAMHDRLDSIKERARGLVDQGQEKVSELKSKVGDVKDQAFTRGHALMDRATDFIRENPLKSVGIAFGIGYIGMRLIRR